MEFRPAPSRLRRVRAAQVRVALKVEIEQLRREVGEIWERKASMSAWYAVFCKPRREEVAEANLSNQGYRVYLPRLATQCRRDGKWVDTVEPLFPRYLFIAAGHERQGLAPVRSTVGVSDLVRFGGQPAIVPEAVVESLRGRQQPGTDTCARRSLFQAGATVGFRAGPFAGLDGVFDVEAGEGRVFVLLDFLGKISKVKVCRDWLVPAT